MTILDRKIHKLTDSEDRNMKGGGKGAKRRVAERDRRDIGKAVNKVLNAFN